MTFLSYILASDDVIDVVVKKTAGGQSLYLKKKDGSLLPAPKPFHVTYPGQTASDAAEKLRKKLKLKTWDEE